MDISRRNFLTGVGGLVAVSQLPSFADDPAVFEMLSAGKTVGVEL